MRLGCSWAQKIDFHLKGIKTIRISCHSRNLEAADLGIGSPSSSAVLSRLTCLLSFCSAFPSTKAVPPSCLQAVAVVSGTRQVQFSMKLEGAISSGGAPFFGKQTLSHYPLANAPAGPHGKAWVARLCPEYNSSFIY